LLHRLWERALPASYSTLWRLLHADAIRPWRHRMWLFPKDPLLLEKAVPILDLYRGQWDGAPLGPQDAIVCADEMPGLQALSRTVRKGKAEFEYTRNGTTCYLAFWEARTGKVAGEFAPSTGIEPFERALGHVLERPWLRDKKRVFLIVDNGSSHHPSTSPARIARRFPQVTTVHLPVHSSWLNQAEQWFSIVSRKALTPRNFESTEALEQRVLAFEQRWNQDAVPFKWEFGRERLAQLMAKMGQKDPLYARHDPAAYDPNNYRTLQ
jgi:hypothetical protein